MYDTDELNQMIERIAEDIGKLADFFKRVLGELSGEAAQLISDLATEPEEPDLRPPRKKRFGGAVSLRTSPRRLDRMPWYTSGFQ